VNHREASSSAPSSGRLAWLAIGVVAALVALALAGLRRGGGDEALFVYVGAGFRLPVEEAAGRFREQTGIPVELSFGGSGCVLAQASLSRRGDLYMPGEEFFMAQARRRDMIVAERPIAHMWPVVLVQEGNPLGITGLDDLRRAGLRVGLGDPEATACGIAADALLQRRGLKAPVAANQIMAALNVNELGTAVALEALDAAIAWDATADLFAADVDVVAIPPGVGRRTTIPLGILSYSKRPEAARRFLEFMASPEGGVAVFREHGYDVSDRTS